MTASQPLLGILRDMSVPAVPTIRGGIEVEIIDGEGNWVQERYRAAELPEVLARDRDVPRAESVIITQFCRDWRSWPEDREWMLEGEPDPAGDPYDLAKVAARHRYQPVGSHFADQDSLRRIRHRRKRKQRFGIG